MEPPENINTEPDFFSAQVSDSRRFYLEMAPPDDVDLAVVCGGVESCARDYAICRQTFPYYSIEFVAQGRGTLTLGGATQPLLAGAVFSYGPGIGQEITTDNERPLRKYFVDFWGQDSIRLLKDAGLPPGTHRTTGAVVDVQNVFDQLIRDGLRATPRTEQLCVTLLRYLLIRLADALPPRGEPASRAYATFQRCRALINAQCDALMSLAEIAQACHVDRAYLCRLFRRFDQLTPHQFLMQRKMNLAAAQLHDSRLLVKQIARRLGFADPFHFSRVFKRVFGVSPEAFRHMTHRQ